MRHVHDAHRASSPDKLTGSSSDTIGSNIKTSAIGDENIVIPNLVGVGPR